MSERGRVRVLIVDDSVTARVALRAAFGADPEIEVVGEAAHADLALEEVKRLRPDLVTMDMYLRGHNGLDVTRQIMHAAPTPIVMVTAANPKDPSLVYEALRVGVLEVMGKLPGPLDPTYERRRQELTRVVKSLSRVPVVRRRLARPLKPAEASEAYLPKPSEAGHPRGWGARQGKPPVAENHAPDPDWRPDVVLLGASTGGPPLICEILRRLPRPFPIPIVVVQHLAPGFTEGFAAWLEAETQRQVLVVRARTQLEGGRVYVADEGSHLKVVTPWQVARVEGPEVSFHKPSVDVLFHSAVRHFGTGALAILCTGMGADGAEGMRALFDRGATTIAQTPASCAVDSMPKSALALGGVCSELGPEEIVAELSRLASPPDGLRAPA